MKNIINKLAKQPLKSIMLMELLIYIFSGIIYYPLIPYLLNYPPNSINTQFQLSVNPMYYWMYYVFLALASIVLIIAISFKKLKPLKKLNKNELSIDEKLNIRKVCLNFNIAYIILYGMLIPTALIMLFLLVSNTGFILTLKIALLALVFLGVPNIIVSIISTMILKYVLINTFDNEVFKNEKNKKTKIWVKQVYQIFFTILVTMVLFFLTFNTTITNELSDNAYESYYKLFSQSINEINNDKNLINTVMNKNFEHDNWFVRYNDTYNYSNDDFQISNFMDEYINFYSVENDYSRVYDNYGLSQQGIVYSFSDGVDEIVIGIVYDSFPSSIFITLFLLLIVFLLVNYIIIYMSSASIGNDLNRISNNLLHISKNKTIKEELLPITSTDEIEDLTTAYNNVQLNDINLINQIHESQDLLVERERLASLGQMIGGIAHNLKTPIMSISGAAEGLTDLIKEYDSSIGDPEVNEQDHHDIAKDMQNWVDKVRDYTSYMSDVITAVKGQAVTLSDEQAIKFNVEELVKRVNILMRHELKNALVTLNVGMNVDPNTELEGNINSLVQVINNMISNAIQCYGGAPDNNIDMNINRDGKELIIEIRDYGPGLPKEVKEKLFKEMITTKGKNGTGLGLFMSYSNIRAHFNGNITFESEEGKGTAFFIHLPIAE